MSFRPTIENDPKLRHSQLRPFHETGSGDQFITSPSFSLSSCAGESPVTIQDAIHPQRQALHGTRRSRQPPVVALTVDPHQTLFRPTRSHRRGSLLVWTWVHQCMVLWRLIHTCIVSYPFSACQSWSDTLIRDKDNFAVCRKIKGKSYSKY